MANAALLITNLALDGTVTASTEETTMPASNLLTPHPSERWRSTATPASVVLNKGDMTVADTFVVSGMTCGAGSTIRMRLSSSDATGGAGDVADETYTAGDANFSIEHGTAVLLLPAAVAFQYARFDLDDPAADYVEAGLITVGAREAMEFNFGSGGLQYVDRSRVTETSAGLKLVWARNTYRIVDLNFDWVSKTQRYGVIETMDRVNGRHINVLIIIDTESDDLGRDSIIGLISDQSPSAYTAAIELFGKHFRLEERI